jgi:hypothetical protein
MDPLEREILMLCGAVRGMIECGSVHPCHEQTLKERLNKIYAGYAMDVPFVEQRETEPA